MSSVNLPVSETGLATQCVIEHTAQGLELWKDVMNTERNIRVASRIP
jgi:hypothetical protein